MTGILDRVAQAAAARKTGFQSMSAETYFALRLADKLGEPAAAQHYAGLLERYSEGQLLVAYHRAKKTGSHLDPARSFHVELERLAGHRCDAPPGRRLAAIRIARRTIAVVVLSGTHLEYPPMTRELSSSNHKALGSAVRFVSTILEQCPFPTAALESREEDDDGRRSLLAQTIEQALAEQEVGIWNVPKAEVLASFGRPPLRFRNQVRDVISNIWPEADGDRGPSFVKDALALGLYCQTELLFF